MDKPESFNVLRTTDSGELVVVADYAATGRTAASFHDLAKLLKADHTIWETAPPPWGQEAGMNGQHQADRWVRDIRESGLKVRTVLGFCGGAVYAAAMSERITQWQAPPKLILFDPGFADRRMLTEHIEGFFSRLAASFTPDQLDEAKVRLAAHDAAAISALDLAARLSGLYVEMLSPAIIRAGWSAQAASESAHIITGYLYWLAGAVNLDPRPQWMSATAMHSATANAGLRSLTEEERRTSFAEQFSFDVAHSDLLRTAVVAETTDRLLDGTLPAHSSAQK